MKARKKHVDPIPKEFASYEEAAEFWDTHDTTDYPDNFSLQVSLNNGNLKVKTGETWNVDFKPTKIRLTFSGLGGDKLITVNLLDSGLTLSWTGGVVSDIDTGVEIDISDPGADLFELQMASFDGGVIIITNIEFWIETTPHDLGNASQGGGANLGIKSQGFGGFGFGW